MLTTIPLPEPAADKPVRKPPHDHRENEVGA